MTSRFACVLLLALAACPAAKSAGDLGKERGDCRPDKTCDKGLLCLSNLCVKPPPADCGEVAETLTSMDLGNYAQVEERAPVVAKYRAQCEKAYVTKEQGRCIDAAKDKWSVAQCAPELVPELASSKTGDCGLVADKIDAMLARQQAGNPNNDYMTKWRAAMVRAYRLSCADDHWPDALKKCTLAADLARTGGQMPPECNHEMPPELQQKLQERVQQAMADMQR